MTKEIEIPEGYEAKIDGNKVILVPKESEDERIRNEIIDYLNFAESHNLLRAAEYDKKKGWLAYLEKQKEQKPAEWSEEKIVNWLKENFYVSSFDNTKIVTKFSSMDDLIKSVRKRFKSLLPQPHWKPSEEQYTSDPRKTDLYKLGKAEALKEIEQDPESSYAFKRGFEYGKEEALKDLPRWKKSTDEKCLNERAIVLAGENDLLCTNYTVEGDYYLLFSELEKLPKED